MNTTIKAIRKQLRPLKRIYKDFISHLHVNKEFQKFKEITKSRPIRKRIYYFGTTENNNLGDNAQYLCILRWIKTFFPDYELIQVEATTIVNRKNKFLPLFKSLYRENIDIIIFQSGYSLQDIGGNHIIMQKMILESLPNANVLMMPQTIFFRNTKNGEEVAEIFNRCHNLLLLARDKTSYNIAKKLFNKIHLLCTPDIVTSLIGHYNLQCKREGFLICHRNDLEVFYTNEDIKYLSNSLSRIASTTISDTSIKKSGKEIRKNLQKSIDEIITKYSKYRVIITDRFHGTIFSLCANTPVIVLKTSDHKVITGAEWFKDIYPEHIKIAKDINECIQLAINLYNTPPKTKILQPYFDKKYFNETLYNEFSNILNREL